MQTFITSDIHFHHKRILEFCPETRPWEDVHEMNEGLIEEWNETVSKRDRIFHLGDFSFAGRTKTEEILKQLNGEKVFILGNHDPHNKKLLEEYGKVYDYRELTWNKVKVILFHFPILRWNAAHHDSIHLHGHMHGSMPYIPGKILDVGYDAQGRILTMDEAVAMANSKAYYGWDEFR